MKFLQACLGGFGNGHCFFRCEKVQLIKFLCETLKLHGLDLLVCKGQLGEITDKQGSLELVKGAELTAY